MKIGFFTDGYLPQPNGVATSVVEAVKELRRRGHEVSIIAPKYPGFVDHDKSVIRLRSLKVFKSPEIRVALNLPDKNMAKILSMDFDVIHGHSGGTITLLGWELAKLKKIPFIVTYHTLWNRYAHYFMKGKVVTPKMLEQATKIFGNQIDRLIAPTKRVESELRRYGVKKPISIVPSGIDVSRFENSTGGFLREKINVKKDPIILFVGRLGREKSIDFLINSFNLVLKNVPTAHFAIVGEGRERKRFEKLAKRLGISGNVHFTGDIEVGNMNRIYRDASVFVFASTTETQGLVLPEALASGVPVVAVNDPAYTCIENGKNGFLVEKDEAKFAEKVGHLLLDKNKQSEMSKNATESARAFSIEASVDLLEEAYYTLVEETNMQSVGKIMEANRRSEQFFVFQIAFFATLIVARLAVFIFHPDFSYPTVQLLGSSFSFLSTGIFLVLTALTLLLLKRRVDLIFLLLFGAGAALAGGELGSLVFARNNILDFWNPMNLLPAVLLGVLPLFFNKKKTSPAKVSIHSRNFVHENPKNPKVSVVMPAYNEAEFIETTLKALLAQTYKDFELIVVDNNSTDNTGEIAKRYGARVIVEKEKGVAAARNTGFANAKGEIIACTDSDSIPPANWVEQIVEAYKKNPSMVAFGGGGLLYSGPNDARAAARFLFPSFSLLDRYLSGGWNLNGFNLSVRSEAFKKIGGFRKDLVMGEDIDLAKRLREVGNVGYDTGFLVNVSGRRYKDGLISGVMTYAPSYVARVLFKREAFMKFPAIRTENAITAQLPNLPLILTLLFLAFLFQISYSRFL